MDEYYTMRGIHFSPRGLKFSLPHNHDISRNDNDRSTCRTSKHQDLGRLDTTWYKGSHVYIFFFFFSKCLEENVSSLFPSLLKNALLSNSTDEI